MLFTEKNFFTEKNVNENVKNIYLTSNKLGIYNLANYMYLIQLYKCSLE